MNAQTQRIRETLGRQEPLVTARGGVLGQIVVCEGCCCGRTDKGFEPLPRDWIKQQWKNGRLNKSVQLTISGCLGPCDLANVFCVISPKGMQWFGGLQERRQYELLLDWANASRAAGVLLESPAELNRHRFERFAVGCGSLAERAVSFIHKGLWKRTRRLRCAVRGGSVRTAFWTAFGRPPHPRLLGRGPDRRSESRECLVRSPDAPSCPFRSGDERCRTPPPRPRCSTAADA